MCGLAGGFLGLFLGLDDDREGVEYSDGIDRTIEIDE